MVPKEAIVEARAFCTQVSLICGVRAWFMGVGTPVLTTLGVPIPRSSERRRQVNTSPQKLELPLSE